jgi:signal transduction histidine kinase
MERGDAPWYDLAMKPTGELEPGVVSTFRLFVGLQLAITVIGVSADWLVVPFWPQSSVAMLAVFSVVEPGLLFLYLSLPRLQRVFHALYLPLGIVWAAAGPLLDPYINLYSTGEHAPEILAQVVLWRQIILLLIPLVVVSWQYTMRQVVLFCVLTTALNIALLSQNPAFQPVIPHALAGIMFVQLSIFTLVGHMIVTMMNAQREQRQHLTAANERLAQYAFALEQLTVSRERNRLARELHDVLAHTLSGVAIELEGVRSMLRLDVARANAMLNRSLQSIREGLTESRRALKALRAKPLEDLGLALAVQALVASTAGRFEFGITVDIDPDLDEYPAEVQQCVYRITQEALANIADHAQAQHAQVVLKRDGDQLRLIICDDGCGFIPQLAAEGTHYGLLGMRERVEMIGGCLTVESQLGQGTQVCLFYEGGQ